MDNCSAFSEFCSEVGRKAVLALCLALCMLRLGLSATAQQDKIIIIDVLAAGTGANQGTLPYGINPAGAITGQYWDAYNVSHGFLRAPDGTITPIDVTGAAGTSAESINPAGAITGEFFDASGVAHGYLRTPDGGITPFDAPGAGSLANSFQGTFASSINPSGWISGFIVDDNGVYHGFLRAPDGSISGFNALDAGTSPGEGTWPAGISGINPAGVIAGSYQDTYGVYHGLVRAPNGFILPIVVWAAGTGSGQGTQTSSINPAGAITGQFVDPRGVIHGFLRTPDGFIIRFDYPGAGKAPGQGTMGSNINPAGEIAGEYIDADGVNHGLMRAPEGKFTPFDCPAEYAGTGSGQGTVPMNNNPAGAITGYCIDANGAFHGFLWTPEVRRWFLP